MRNNVLSYILTYTSVMNAWMMEEWVARSDSTAGTAWLVPRKPPSFCLSVCLFELINWVCSVCWMYVFVYVYKQSTLGMMYDIKCGLNYAIATLKTNVAFWDFFVHRQKPSVLLFFALDVFVLVRATNLNWWSYLYLMMMWRTRYANTWGCKCTKYEWSLWLIKLIIYIIWGNGISL